MKMVTVYWVAQFFKIHKRVKFVCFRAKTSPSIFFKGMRSSDISLERAVYKAVSLFKNRSAFSCNTFLYVFSGPPSR